MQALKKLLVRLLRDTANRIEAGTCELSEEEASQIMEVLSHTAMSKEQACIYLNMSRSKFDDMVSKGLLPKGKKRTGFKELVFYRDELDRCKK